jgi:hypothetical protein
MNAATAYLGLLTTFAALGPGAPFAAAAITGPALKVQLAAINAQSPPKFAIGGMVGDRVQGSADHVTIAATPKEAVLTERGVDGVGGPKGGRRAQRGAGAWAVVSPQSTSTAR